MAQVIDHLLSKYEAWNSNPSLPKKKNKKVQRKEGIEGGIERGREGGRKKRSFSSQTPNQHHTE
jgi:hypothetical protein